MFSFCKFVWKGRKFQRCNLFYSCASGRWCIQHSHRQWRSYNVWRMYINVSFKSSSVENILTKPATCWSGRKLPFPGSHVTFGLRLLIAVLITSALFFLDWLCQRRRLQSTRWDTGTTRGWEKCACWKNKLEKSPLKWGKLEMLSGCCFFAVWKPFVIAVMRR